MNMHWNRVYQIVVKYEVGTKMIQDEHLEVRTRIV